MSGGEFGISSSSREHVRMEKGGAMSKIIQTPSAPAAIGPYSQGIRVGNLVFTAGQIGIDPQTGEIVSGGITAETERALLNVKGILEAAGSSLERVVKTTVFLTNLNEFAQMNRAYERLLGGNLPARSTVQVTLPKGAKVEIEAIATVD
jgi:2-iminobutanoate/2-iminopropanoate deaminase